MEIAIGLTKALSHYNNGGKEATQEMPEGSLIIDLFDVLDKRMPGIKILVLDQEGAIADSMNIYVNGDNVRYLQGVLTPLSDGDRVSIVPAAAAG